MPRTPIELEEALYGVTPAPSPAAPAPAPSLADAARELVAAVGAWPVETAAVKMPEGARVAAAVEATLAALSAEAERERLRGRAATIYLALPAHLLACLPERDAAELRRWAREECGLLARDDPETSR